MADLRKVRPKVLRPSKRGWALATSLCQVTPHTIACSLGGQSGGFQMGAFFARIASFDDAPAGWPWDGKVHARDELILGD